MSTSKQKPAFRVVSVYKHDGKESFAEIGAAWVIAKGGYVLRLNAHPIGDTVLLRPYTDKSAADHSPEA